MTTAKIASLIYDKIEVLHVSRKKSTQFTVRGILCKIEVNTSGITFKYKYNNQWFEVRDYYALAVCVNRYQIN